MIPRRWKTQECHHQGRPPGENLLCGVDSAVSFHLLHLWEATAFTLSHIPLDTLPPKDRSLITLGPGTGWSVDSPHPRLPCGEGPRAALQPAVHPTDPPPSLFLSSNRNARGSPCMSSCLSSLPFTSPTPSQTSYAYSSVMPSASCGQHREYQD